MKTEKEIRACLDKVNEGYAHVLKDEDNSILGVMMHNTGLAYYSTMGSILKWVLEDETDP